MTFEELQEKANRRFGRRLSDREIAEVAIENLNEAEAKADSLETAIEGYREEIHQLRGELSDCGRLSDLGKNVSERINEILDIGSDACTISVVKNEKGVFMDFAVYGNPIQLNEDDYE